MSFKVVVSDEQQVFRTCNVWEQAQNGPVLPKNARKVVLGDFSKSEKGV
jgi:hypothetical protein